MSDNEKVLIAARNFVERFGEDAPAEAKRRAQEMHIFGKAEGYALWMMILEQVKFLVGEGVDETKH